MDTCFQCGGKLKIVAKPGRMAYGIEDENDELYEIPAELRISTCTVCGWMFEDEYWMKIQRACDAQRKCAPGMRVEMLRHIDKFIRSVIERPGMFGTVEAVEATILTLLNVRTAVLDKGKTKDQSILMQEYRKFLSARIPNMGNTHEKFYALDLNEEVAPMLSEFCDVWVNVVT